LLIRAGLGDALTTMQQVGQLRAAPRAVLDADKRASAVVNANPVLCAKVPHHRIRTVNWLDMRVTTVLNLPCHFMTAVLDVRNSHRSLPGESPVVVDGTPFNAGALSQIRVANATPDPDFR
jgi:hypothetical protein